MENRPLDWPSPHLTGVVTFFFPAIELFCSRDNCMTSCHSSMQCGLINADERAAGKGYKQQAGCDIVQMLS